MDATVVFDSIGFKDKDGNRHFADKDDAVELTDAEFKRLSGLGAVTAGDTSQEMDDEAAAIERLGKKDDLVAAAEALGVEHAGDATKSAIAQALSDAGFDADEVSAEIPVA